MGGCNERVQCLFVVCLTYCQYTALAVVSAISNNISSSANDSSTINDSANEASSINSSPFGSSIINSSAMCSSTVATYAVA